MSGSVARGLKLGEAEKLELRLAVARAGLSGTKSGRAVALALEGLGIRAMAEREGVPIETIYARLNHARRRGVALPMFPRPGRPPRRGALQLYLSEAAAGRIAALAKARGLTPWDLASALVETLAGEPVLIDNLLDEQEVPVGGTLTPVCQGDDATEAKGGGPDTGTTPRPRCEHPAPVMITGHRSHGRPAGGQTPATGRQP